MSEDCPATASQPQVGHSPNHEIRLQGGTGSTAKTQEHLVDNKPNTKVMKERSGSGINTVKSPGNTVAHSMHARTGSDHNVPVVPGGRRTGSVHCQAAADYYSSSEKEVPRREATQGDAKDTTGVKAKKRLYFEAEAEKITMEQDIMGNGEAGGLGRPGLDYADIGKVPLDPG